MSRIVALYADGGVIERNPSPHGGTWAWRAVDEAGEVVVADCGLIESRGMTNNFTEFMAALKALEAMADGWSGKLCSDSQVTIGRMTMGWALNGLRLTVVKRGSAVLQRLGKIEPVLLQGHPTRADLVAGIGSKRGLPVSAHNVACDQECQRLAREFLTKLNGGRLS